MVSLASAKDGTLSTVTVLQAVLHFGSSMHGGEPDTTPEGGNRVRA
jgi:hypothetical protein